jgi:hypothetical protein
MSLNRRLGHSILASATLLAAALGCSALSRHPQQPAPADSVAADSQPGYIDIQIDNHNWSDVVVFVTHGGTRTRLGTAHTARTTAFRFPASYEFARRLTLVAEAIGSPTRFESEGFSVLSGQRVYLTLESSLARSSLLIR